MIDTTKGLRSLMVGILTLIGVLTSMGYAQTPVKFVINSLSDFSNVEEKANAVVEFPGETAHQIFTKMAINAGVLFYQPDKVVYAVEDSFISLSCASSDFCRSGNEKWQGDFQLKFVIKPGKVLVLTPKVQEVKKSKTLNSLTFKEFIHTYWYDDKAGDFITSEYDNMTSCENYVNSLINTVLGIEPLNILPAKW